MLSSALVCYFMSLHKAAARCDAILPMRRQAQGDDMTEAGLARAV